MKTGPPLALIQPGRTFITDFCVNNAKAVVDAWWELGDDLLVKYNHFCIYDADTRKVDRVQTPESWNRAVIEHDKLVPGVFTDFLHHLSLFSLFFFG